MKRTTGSLCSLTIAAFVAVTVCAASPCRAEAESTTTIFHIPFENTTELDCGNGVQDVVTYSSPLIVVAHFGTDAQGGVHSEFQDTFQGGSGIGISGATYRAIATDHTSFNSDVLPFETTFVLSQLLVGEGQAPKFEVHITIHMTVNANGEPTAEVVHVEYQCR